MKQHLVPGALALAALLSLAPCASAGVGEGDTAPDFTGKEFLNTPEVDMKALRGRVILFEIFRTW